MSVTTLDVISVSICLFLISLFYLCEYECVRLVAGVSDCRLPCGADWLLSWSHKFKGQLLQLLSMIQNQ